MDTSLSIYRLTVAAVSLLWLVGQGHLGAALPDITIDSVVVISAHEMRLSWQPDDKPAKRGRNKIRYTVRYRHKGGKYTHKTVNRPEVYIARLTGNTTYMFAVRSVKGNKYGAWSASMEGTTLPVVRNVGEPDAGYGIVFIKEVGATSVRLAWRLHDNAITNKEIKWFKVSWRIGKGGVIREDFVKKSRYTITNLKPGVAYSASVSVLLKTAGKQRLQTVKLTTQPFFLPPPKNVKFSEVNATSFKVKWRHVKAPNEESPITAYLLEYTRVNAFPLERCQLEVNGTQRSKVIKGLRPDTQYRLRLAGKSGNTTGSYTDWFSETTAEIDQFVRDKSEGGLRGFVVSPTEIVVFWKYSYPDGNTYLERKIGGTYQSKLQSRFLQDGVHFFHDLMPMTSQLFVLKQFPPSESCPINSFLYLSTAEDQPVVTETADYDAYLRLLPLPDGSHVVLWEQVVGDDIFYILKANDTAEGTSYFVNRGNNSVRVLDGLDLTFPFIFTLRVFDVGRPDLTFPAQTLVVEGDDAAEDSDPAWNYDVISAVTSTDLFVSMEPLLATDDVRFTFNGESQYIRHELQDKPWHVIVSVDPGASYNVVTVNDSNGSLLENITVSLATPEEPSIYDIGNKSLYEGDSLEAICRCHGDPSPRLDWANGTEAVFDESRDSQDSRLSTSSYRREVVDRARVAMETVSTIRISDVRISDTGVYACVAENVAGMAKKTFRISVRARPPGPVTNLRGVAVTPYEIRFEWEPPANASNIILGYVVAIEDEYGFGMTETNTTQLFYTQSSLIPESTYKVHVFAYTNETRGFNISATTRTRPLPILDPPSNVSIHTLNGTVIHVTWVPPYAVRIQYLHLRSFLVNYRLRGKRFAEELELDKETLSARIIGLDPNQMYDVRVIAMSEDGQVSYSDWEDASTGREAYMNESIAPKPPKYVYLRAENGNILVTWHPPLLDDNVLIRSFSINVKANDTLIESLEVNHEESSIIVYDAEPNTKYRISVRANNKAGASLEEAAELIMPEEEVSQHAVRNFTGYALSSTKLMLKWEKPIEGRYSQFLLVYTIAGNELPGSSGGGNLPHFTREYVVRSLKPYTEYYFEITPFLKRKQGKSANVSVKTFSDKPTNPPSNISTTIINSTAIALRCHPPLEGKNGRVLWYKVSYRSRGRNRNTVTAVADEEDESANCVISELFPKTVYEFRVKAQTINGSGPWSDWFAVKTPEPAPVFPSTPRNMTTIAGYQSIYVTWSMPQAEIKFIDGFIAGYGQYLPEVFRKIVSKDDDDNSVAFRTTLNGLDPNTGYIVSVRSFNEYGESEAAFQIATTTSGRVDTKA